MNSGSSRFMPTGVWHLIQKSPFVPLVSLRILACIALKTGPHLRVRMRRYRPLTIDVCVTRRARRRRWESILGEPRLVFTRDLLLPGRRRFLGAHNDHRRAQHHSRAQDTRQRRCIPTSLPFRTAIRWTLHRSVLRSSIVKTLHGAIRTILTRLPNVTVWPTSTFVGVSTGTSSMKVPFRLLRSVTVTTFPRTTKAA